LSLEAEKNARSARPTVAILGSKGLPFVYSGYETFVSELTRHLRDRYEFHIYCHRALFRERPRETDGVMLHYTPALETRFTSHLSHSLLATLHAIRQNFDLYFYVNSCNGPFGRLLRLFGKRSILNTDGLEWRRPQLRGPAARYYYWASRMGANLFDALVSDSAEMAAVYLEEFGRKSEVIEYGAHTDQPESPGELARWALKRDDYYLVVGRLIPDNNADLIMDGLLRSKSRRRLVIVGDLLFRDKWAQRLRKVAPERVTFTGFVRDPAVLRALFTHSFAYLHGHQFGGTNPTLLDGLAAGCAILALDTPFNREVLANGTYGLHFDQRADSLASGIDRLESDQGLLQDLRTRARQRIDEKYNWNRISDSYHRLFQNVLTG